MKIEIVGGPSSIEEYADGGRRLHGICEHEVWVDGYWLEMNLSAAAEVWADDTKGVVVKIENPDFVQVETEIAVWHNLDSYDRRNFADVLAWGRTKVGLLWVAKKYINSAEITNDRTLKRHHKRVRQLSEKYDLWDCLRGSNHIHTKNGVVIVDWGAPDPFEIGLSYGR